ncbi:MAG: winged helix-turn-helix transcriptional regulator [Streptosporangiaceae bacterium]
MESATIRLTGPLDARENWDNSGCPIAGAIDVVGARSAFLLLREAFYGTSRFDDFAERAGISQPVAAARLRELVEDGLLAREPYREPGQRARMEYRLTEKGAEFFPVLAALMQWGDRWARPAPLEFRHRDCGAAVHSELRCAEGHQVSAGDLDLAITEG